MSVFNTLKQALIDAAVREVTCDEIRLTFNKGTPEWQLYKDNTLMGTAEVVFSDSPKGDDVVTFSLSGIEITAFIK